MIYSRYTLVALFILIIILVNGVWNSYNKYRRSAEADAKSEQELAVLEQRKNNLDKSIAMLSTQEGKEREIRERFGLVKDGEKMVVFVDDNEASTAMPVSKAHWWDWIVDLLR